MICNGIGVSSVRHAGAAANLSLVALAVASCLASCLAFGCGARSGLTLEGTDTEGDAGTDAAAACLPSPERCNGVDDDCDGAADEGLGFGLISGPHTVADTVVFIPAIVETRDGLLAAWRGTLDGLSPEPNGYARPLDELGAPSGPRVMLMAEPVVLGPGLARGPAPDVYYVPLCRRFGYDDRPSWIRVDGRGMPVGDEHAVSGGITSCVTYDTTPQMLHTGRATLYSWTVPRYFNPAHLELSDDGDGAEVIEIADNVDISQPPRMARVGDRVAFVFGTDEPEERATELIVTWLDLRGRPTGRQLRLPLDSASRWQQPRATPDGAGNVAVASSNRFDAGWMWLRVDRNGALVDGPTVRPDNLTVRAVAHRAAGGYWMSVADSPSALLRLDETGEPQERWDLPEESRNPEMVVHRGRVTLLYSAPRDTREELRAVTYGCRPD